MVLKEVEVPPGHFLIVMGFAQRSALRTGETASSWSGQSDPQFMGRALGVQRLTGNFPGFLNSKA
jgi:hypothetical protein